MRDLNVVIAGAAGEGIQTVGAVLAETVSAQASKNLSLFLTRMCRTSSTFIQIVSIKWVQAGALLVNLSPERPMKYIPRPSSYELRPGQGIVVLASRDSVQED